jgi:putative ABC transport system ATP-binding protein
MAPRLSQAAFALTHPLLAASQLGRRRPESPDWLFRHIQLEIEPGDRLALVGPTGCGKSLILRALALLDSVDEGEIAWRGKSISDRDVPEYRARALYLQQRSPVLEGTVIDNLKVPFELHLRRESPSPENQLAQLLDHLGRDERFLATRTMNLSGGERQIVALLRALLVSPMVLLLDEPSAALDPHTTSTLEQLVDSWQRQVPAERAFVWVTHDPEQAKRVAHRVIRLDAGRIEAAP